MNKLKYWIAALLLTAGIGGSVLTTVVPQTAMAQSSESSCGGRFITLPPWYRGLTDDNCNIEAPASGSQTADDNKRSMSGFIWTIALNVIEIMLHIVGYAAVGFIIYGGFIYLTSSGQADKVAGAKRTIMNAVIGLVISIFAIAIVNMVVGAF